MLSSQRVLRGVSSGQGRRRGAEGEGGGVCGIVACECSDMWVCVSVRKLNGKTGAVRKQFE